MTIFGKRPSEYVAFSKPFLNLILVVGIVRFVLSFAGVPNSSCEVVQYHRCDVDRGLILRGQNSHQRLRQLQTFAPNLCPPEPHGAGDHCSGNHPGDLHRP